MIGDGDGISWSGSESREYRSAAFVKLGESFEPTKNRMPMSMADVNQDCVERGCSAVK